ncbi:ATP-binding protein [Lacinutrix neustonica]|uniref:histidine kinase n=1 Tax=Lacinutrix neustonica TaxID=2980107 RepID=A0A9E8SEN9_9FLAO|nr:ATP-binding protein [Lacinutrix neustonica]WAC03411.1 ATP-binding protein [Lacinutrix neustonica]
MKKIYYNLVFLLISIVTTHAQQESETSIDPMYKEIDSAFELCQRNKYGEAIEIGTKVLEYSIEVNDDNLRARAYNVLGNAHYFVSNDSLSFHYLFKAKDLYIKLKDTSKIILAYSNLGVNYRVYGDFTKSSSFFKKSLKLAEKSKSPKQSVYPLFNIGLNFVAQNDDNDNDYEQGLIYLSKAESVAERYYEGDAIIGEISQILIFVHYKLGNYKKSTEYYNKTITFSEKYNYLNVLAGAHSTVSIINAEDKNFEKAYTALNAYVTVKDSLSTIEQFEKAKQVEADNFLKENSLKLKLKEKENALQEVIITETKGYNIILGLFVLVLLLLAFLLYVKAKELKQAKERAENLSKVKSDFYSEISHELRTPLYAVIELSNLLLREDVNVRHREYLESLQFSRNHLLSLVNNVLELNKVESGTMKIQLLDFDLKNILSNIIESLEFALRDSNNTIHLVYDNSIPDVLVGDSLKISQIFINLISNAVKFTNNGRITVTIKKLEELEDDIKLYFEVADTGVGIPKEKQHQVFEDFYQEHAKVEKSYKGTGLGLSIVKRVVTAMGSKVQLESEEGKGSTFFFELALKKSQKNNNIVELYDLQLKEIEGSNILIVDDNRINRLVTKRVLGQLNINSEAVDSR